MTFSSSAKPIGFYTSHTADDAGVLDQLQELYGSRFEQMERQWKLLFRGALATYLAIRPIWVDGPEGEVTCAQACICGAGGDDLDIWDEQPELADLIQEACEDLPDGDIEGLIEALTAQLR
jgi:hypothetical protein